MDYELSHKELRPQTFWLNHKKAQADYQQIVLPTENRKYFGKSLNPTIPKHFGDVNHKTFEVNAFGDNYKTL